MSIRNSLRNCQDERFKAMSQYILNYDKGYGNLSSKELIANFYISSAGISKFVKSLGVSSFPELKYTLLATEKIYNATEDNIVRDLIIPKHCKSEYKLLYNALLEKNQTTIYTTCEYANIGGLLTDFCTTNDEDSEQIIVIFGNPKHELIDSLLSFSGEVFIFGSIKGLYFAPELENFHYFKFSDDKLTCNSYILNIITYLIYDLQKGRL